MTTLQDFETYKFGIKTRILHEDEWWEVVGVDFEDNSVKCKNLSHWVGYEDIDEIREAK